jgi:hypothetical protein
VVDDWLLAVTFGDSPGHHLLVRTPWRLVNAEGLQLSSADDSDAALRGGRPAGPDRVDGGGRSARFSQPVGLQRRGGAETFTTRRHEVPWVWTAPGGSEAEAPLTSG